MAGSALLLALFSCTKPTPIAGRVQVGMKTREVVQLIGEPLYRGGFLPSADSTERRTLLLLYVYPDSSLVVFRRDTVYKTFDNVQFYKKALLAGIEK